MAIENTVSQHLCAVPLGKIFFPLLSTSSAQVDPSRYDCKIVDWDVKNQTKSAGFNLRVIFI